MNRKTLIVGALALSGALAAGMAQARSDVQWSVTIGAPIGIPVYSQPYPVYSQPYPVYTQPQPVYTRPYPVYSQPVPVYQHQQPWRGHTQYQEPTRWDRDGDGVPNRYDRLYNPRWDRDGDGIPNRYERRADSRHDRDRDGIPNWRDHDDGWRGR